MSQSYPSSSWEPYGSSQQQHALGWRRTATRPARPSPPSQFPALARWNQFHAPPLTDPFPLPKPTSNPQDQFTASAALQQHERDRRSLERYNTVRTDVSALDSKLQRILSTVEDIRNAEKERHQTIASEFAKVHTGCIRLRDDIRGEIVRLEARLTESVQAVLSTTVESAMRRVVGASFSEWKQLIKNAVSDLKTDARRAHGPDADVSGRQTETRRQAPAVMRGPRHRHDAPECNTAKQKVAVHMHSSDEEYALRVAYRKRDNLHVLSGSSSSDGNDSIDQWMASQDDNRPRGRRAAKRPRIDAGSTFLEKKKESCDSLSGDQDDLRDRHYTPSGSLSSSSSGSSSWLPRCRRGKRIERREDRNTRARKNAPGGGQRATKERGRKLSAYEQGRDGRKRKRRRR